MDLIIILKVIIRHQKENQPIHLLILHLLDILSF